MPRFAYKGTPPRSWIRVELVAPDGSTRRLEAVADTGNPLPIIVGSEVMNDFRHSSGPGTATNFGRLEGGFLRLRIPDTNFDAVIFGYGGDRVTDAIQSSDPSFEALVGLPLLRKLEFGGNADEFWIR